MFLQVEMIAKASEQLAKEVEKADGDSSWKIIFWLMVILVLGSVLVAAWIFKSRDSLMEQMYDEKKEAVDVQNKTILDTLSQQTRQLDKVVDMLGVIKDNIRPR